MKESNKVKKMVTIAMLSAIAYVLMLFQFPLIPGAGFLQVDFGDIPALIGGIIFGPITGVLIVLFRNLLHVLITGSSTMGIGATANFIAGTLFILPIVLIYRKYPSLKALIFGLFVGTVVMTAGLAVLNYFIFLPLYARVLNFEFPSTIIITAIIPFNLLKGLIVSVVFVFFYQNIKVWMNRRIAAKQAVKTTYK